MQPPDSSTGHCRKPGKHSGGCPGTSDPEPDFETGKYRSGNLIFPRSEKIFWKKIIRV